MVKSGITKSVLLLAFIGLIIVGLVQPIAGDTDQGKSSGQVCVCKKYSNNTTMNCEKDYCNNITMNCGENYNCCVMACGKDYCNNTTMDCKEGYDCCVYNCEQDYIRCLIDCEMDYGNNTTMDFEKDYCNKTMMPCMMEMGKNTSASQADIDCADYNMEEAIKIHEMHLMNPNSSTEESNMEMMDHMMQAYECLTGENLTSEMMMDCEKDSDNKSMMKEAYNKTIMDCEKDSTNKTMMMEEDSENETMMHCCMMHCMMHCMKEEHSENATTMPCMMEDHAGNATMMPCMMEDHADNATMMPCMMEDHADNATMMPCMMEDHAGNETCCLAGMNQNTSSAHVNLCCTSFWLKQAIELHEMHMKDPGTMTEESQKELMCQMLRADMCITGKSMMTMDIMGKEADNKSTEWVTETAAYLSM